MADDAPRLTVADWLAESRAAHYRKKQSAGRADKRGHVTTPPNYITTEAHIKDAFLARRADGARQMGKAQPSFSST